MPAVAHRPSKPARHSDQVRSIPGSDHSVVRIANDLPPDLYRRTAVAEGRVADMGWIFGRQMGRRYLCRRNGRLQWKDVAGPGRASGNGCDASDGTVHT